jgi:hypothetical protein
MRISAKCIVSLWPEDVDKNAESCELIERWQKRENWSDEAAGCLKKLVCNNNPIITGALDCFRFANDDSDIIETLNLILQLAQHN